MQYEVGDAIKFSDEGKVRYGKIVKTTPLSVDVQVGKNEMRVKKLCILGDAPDRPRWEVGVRVVYPESSFVLKSDQIFAATEEEARDAAVDRGWRLFPAAQAVEPWGCAKVEEAFYDAT